MAPDRPSFVSQQGSILSSLTLEDVVARLRSALVSTALPFSLALMGGGTPAVAQQSAQTIQEWSLQNVRAAWCVHFLMDSAEADRELPRDFRTVRAADFTELSPAIKNLISGEPEFQAWVPALWCSFYFDQAKVGDQTLGSDTPDLSDTQYLGIWLIGSSPGRAATADATTPSYYVATMRTPNWRMIRLAETSLIKMDYAEPAIGKVPEASDDRYRVEMGRTIITWDGHLAGDSASAAPPSDQTWWMISSRGARMRAQVRLTMEKRQNVAGTLQIAGNDRLAKSLRASPIRMVGPLNWGGMGTLSFSR